jgi:hypothetical protein
MASAHRLQVQCGGTSAEPSGATPSPLPSAGHAQNCRGSVRCDQKFQVRDAAPP